MRFHCLTAPFLTLTPPHSAFPCVDTALQYLAVEGRGRGYAATVHRLSPPLVALHPCGVAHLNSSALTHPGSRSRARGRSPSARACATSPTSSSRPPRPRCCGRRAMWWSAGSARLPARRASRCGRWARPAIRDRVGGVSAASSRLMPTYSCLRVFRSAGPARFSNPLDARTARYAAPAFGAADTLASSLLLLANSAHASLFSYSQFYLPAMYLSRLDGAALGLDLRCLRGRVRSPLLLVCARASCCMRQHAA